MAREKGERDSERRWKRGRKKDCATQRTQTVGLWLWKKKQDVGKPRTMGEAGNGLSMGGVSSDTTAWMVPVRAQVESWYTVL